MRCAWVLYEIAKFTLNWSKNWLIHFTLKLNIEGRKEMVALMVFCKCWGDSRELLVSLERSLPALAANAVNIPLWQVSSSRPNHVFFVHLSQIFMFTCLRPRCIHGPFHPQALCPNVSMNGGQPSVEGSQTEACSRSHTNRRHFPSLSLAWPGSSIPALGTGTTCVCVQNY